MVINEYVNQMLSMQMALDNEIERKKNIRYGAGSKFNYMGLRYALLDEIGELCHELKGFWCWWKDTQEAPVKDRILEELIDVWHFGLSIHYHEVSHRYNCTLELEPNEGNGCSVMNLIDVARDSGANIIDDLLYLTYGLGFTIEEVYAAYINKNKVNYLRLKNGY